MSDVFISYARSTAAQAQQVAEGLRALGYGVWRDDEIPAHRAYADVIEERLRAAKAVVVIWSAEAAKSEWVRSEAERARTDQKLVQLTLDGARLPMPFDQIQCADLSGWTGDLEAPGWKKVVGSIAALTVGEGPAPRAAPQPAARKLSICVLPFANMSDDPQQEYFSDGISEDIITDLSKVSALSVVARNTAFTFKGKSLEVPQVAKQLNVSHVLEGSVRKAGGRVRITAQLIDGTAGDHVWAERYDRDLTDIFALQDEISQAIVAALKLKLLPEEKKAIAHRGTDSVDAYNLFLMARQYLDTGNAGDARREEAIIRLCQRAVEIDTGYARAWSLMAYAQSLLRFNRGKAGEDGLTAAEKAIALDPTLAEPHAVKAKVLSDYGRRDEAFTELEIGLRLDPESDVVQGTAGVFYFQDGRFAEGVPHLAKAAALNEADFGSAGMLISGYTAIGDREGARQAALTTLPRVEKVVARDPTNGHAVAFGVMALAVLAQAERAKEWIDRTLLIDPDNLLMRYNFACALSAYLKDSDTAIDLLGPVFANISIALLNSAKSDPDLDPIREDPRFRNMLAEAEARMAAAGTG
ncbi:MAG TPA: TIR domain-containing protein [Caulobacteraceae bacterium]|jgi:adenylate cyclase|nr:TIR domain-containing protein [Caulobacteraceae bacterium]